MNEPLVGTSKSEPPSSLTTVSLQSEPATASFAPRAVSRTQTPDSILRHSNMFECQTIIFPIEILLVDDVPREKRRMLEVSVILGGGVIEQGLNVYSIYFFIKSQWCISPRSCIIMSMFSKHLLAHNRLASGHPRVRFITLKMQRVRQSPKLFSRSR